MSEDGISPETPTSKVVIAAIVCWVLGFWFANLITSFGGSFFLRPFGFVIAVWVASKIARERVVNAALPTAGFLLLFGVLATFSAGRSDILRVLTILGTALACLAYAWWLGDRARKTMIESAPAQDAIEP